VYVSKRPVTGGQTGAGDAERVDVGGHTGRLSSVADDWLLSWSCEGASYTVTGPLAREELVALAESMACE
jgi:anti-sigma factor RsiW